MDLHLIAGDMILNDAGLWVAMRYTSLSSETARMFQRGDATLRPHILAGITADMPPFGTLWHPGHGRVHDLRSAP